MKAVQYRDFLVLLEGKVEKSRIYSDELRTVAVHVSCTTRQMELGDTLVKLASLCAENVVVPEVVGCCGFAGDKGMTNPELNEYALRKLRGQIKDVEVGYSNSRTCEIGLQHNSGIPYVPIVYLVNACTIGANTSIQDNYDTF